MPSEMGINTIGAMVPGRPWGEMRVFASVSKQLRRRDRGFTLIELVVVLAILGILIALAVPRYLGARKKAYKAEGDNILQEAKTLEWAYYQQYNTFDSAETQIGHAMPAVTHWSSPPSNGSSQQITILMSGALAPLGGADSIWLWLSADGTSGAQSSF